MHLSTALIQALALAVSVQALAVPAVDSNTDIKARTWPKPPGNETLPKFPKKQHDGEKKKPDEHPKWPRPGNGTDEKPQKGQGKGDKHKWPGHNVKVDLTNKDNKGKGNCTEEKHGEEKKPEGEKKQPEGEKKQPEGEKKKPEDEKKKPEDEKKKPEDEKKKPEDEKKKPEDEKKKPEDEKKPEGEKKKPEDEKKDPIYETQPWPRPGNGTNEKHERPGNNEHGKKVCVRTGNSGVPKCD